MSSRPDNTDRVLALKEGPHRLGKVKLEQGFLATATERVTSDGTTSRLGFQPLHEIREEDCLFFFLEKPTAAIFQAYVCVSRHYLENVRGSFPRRSREEVLYCLA